MMKMLRMMTRAHGTSAINTPADVAIPYSPVLEKAVIPDKQAVLRAVKDVLADAGGRA